MKIGSYKIANPVIAAPMAGVTDKPYRKVCRQHGAGLVVSEMITSQADLRHSRKTRHRMDLVGEPEPIVVQIVGTDPTVMAEAAQFNVQNGAQIIDINMGCPAKKVCKKAAGSALLANEPLVYEILKNTVASVDVPVTVKIRTGTDPEQKNAVSIAKIAQDVGISAITVHGRTRECKFVGNVEYDTIAAVKQAITIPVIANGDIDSPKTAKHVIDYTGADAVMIGRAAQGQPWLFSQIAAYLEDGSDLKIPTESQRISTIFDHLQDIHQFYGDVMGVRLARKHIKWYLHYWHTDITDQLRSEINHTDNQDEQLELLGNFLIQKKSALAA
ncbi:UNVERIFIED_CONTAM: hypothetical protein GTU68_013868 [Idotea baltica]|nr:hypothetical protein [Idotea baltica]